MNEQRVKCALFERPQRKRLTILLDPDRKMGHDDFARSTEFAEDMVDAGRRKSEIRRLDIRTEFIGEQQVRSVDALTQQFAEE